MPYDADLDRIHAERVLCEHNRIQVIARVVEYGDSGVKLQICEKYTETGNFSKGNLKRMPPIVAVEFISQLSRFIEDYHSLLGDKDETES